MSEIIPDRIKLARRLCRYSMADLVREMGNHAVSTMAISKFERGQMRPTPATMQAIADACHQPLSFFCRPQLNLGMLQYRFRENVTQRQRQEVKAMADEMLQRYFQAQGIEGNVCPFVHPMRGTTLRNYADVEAAALKLRRRWEIGLQPIHSVYELLASYGFHILELDLGCENIDGLSTFVNAQVPVIIINARTHTTPERKRFTALHEVCHLLFRLRPDDEAHHQAYLSTLPPLPYAVEVKQPDVERLCHRFAGAMLIPQSSLQRRIGTMRTDVSLTELIAIRNLYGISIAAQVHRLHDLRIINDSLYSHFFEVPIRENRMEIGWGAYPINEVADRLPLLEERLRLELAKSDEPEQ